METIEKEIADYKIAHVNTYINTYIHTYIHTYIAYIAYTAYTAYTAYLDTYILTYIHTYINTRRCRVTQYLKGCPGPRSRKQLCDHWRT